MEVLKIKLLNSIDDDNTWFLKKREKKKLQWIEFTNDRLSDTCRLCWEEKRRMCVCSVQWWWTSSVRTLSLIHHPQIEPVIKRKEKKKKREKGEGRYTYIVTPAAVKWSIFIVRTSVGERTNGRSQEKGRDKDGSTNIHIYICVRPSRVKWTDEKNEKASPDGQLNVRFVFIVWGCMF